VRKDANGNRRHVGSATRSRNCEAVTSGDIEERARLSTATGHAEPEGVVGTSAMVPTGR
jgi:hypothetical protein